VEERKGTLLPQNRKLLYQSTAELKHFSLRTISMQ